MRAPGRISLSVALVVVYACVVQVHAAAAGDSTLRVGAGQHGSRWTDERRRLARGHRSLNSGVLTVHGRSMHITRWVTPTDAAWLLVVGRARAADSRCWLPVRLPWRPNGSTGWVNADKVLVARTPWRIVVSTARHTLTLFRAGEGRPHRVGGGR